MNNNSEQVGSTTTATSESEEGEPSHPPLLQLNLHDSFVEAGCKLQLRNPELFAHAIMQLSSQLSLAVVKNPEVLCLSTPTDRPVQSSHPGQESSGSKQQEESHKPQKHCCYRKYMLPGDANEQEYYQCMICKEKRQENSFTNHVHLGEKSKIRWFCPLCNAFFAVTHRSGHIKNRHSTTAAEEAASSPTSFCSSDEAIERRVAMIASATAAAVVSATTRSSLPRQPEEDDGGCYSPPVKRACVYSDDQGTTFSGSPSTTSSPLSQYSEDMTEGGLFCNLPHEDGPKPLTMIIVIPGDDE